MYGEQNKTIVLRYYEELFERRRLAVVDEIFASGYVNHHRTDPYGTDEIRGLEDFKKSVAEFFSAFPDHHTAVDDIIAEGDRVVTRWTTRGTHQGHLFGIAPTNKRVTFSGITIDRVVDEKIVETWASCDLRGLLQQLGADSECRLAA
jgi:steroid delta-isomerase-like uncharacterized protein